MAERLGLINQHLSSTCPKSRNPNPEDVVIVSALRTPLTRARRGPMKNTHTEDMLATVLKGVIEKSGIKPSQVNDICVGNVLAPGGGAMTARMASFAAGFPESTCVYACNRQCSSGLQAVANIANAITVGEIEIGIGAGVESMTMHYGPGAQPSSVSERVMSIPEASDCAIPMGITSDSVAEEFHVTRIEQEEFAVESHRKAGLAQKNGYFNEEIVPVNTTILDKEGNEKNIIVDKDDGIRFGTTKEMLAKLQPAFNENGTTTAATSSQVTDGAAAVLMMKRKKAMQLGLRILGRFVAFSTAGVPPRIMGVGPAYAIPQVLKKTGYSLQDIDIFEINEAFASQAIYCVKKLGINPNKVNPKGGAIAIGHPLGCTGARQIATLLPELKRQQKKIGIVSMCIGTGMGAAAVIEAEY